MSACELVEETGHGPCAELQQLHLPGRRRAVEEHDMLVISRVLILHLRKFAQLGNDFPDQRTGLIEHLQSKRSSTGFSCSDRVNRASERFEMLGENTDEPIFACR